MENNYQIEQNDILCNLKKELVDSKKINSHPKAILLGGLSGAGKTQLCNSVLQQYSDREFVVIDVDEFRQYTPDLQRENISNTELVERTAKFCNKVADSILEYALQKKKDIVINTTLRETDLMLDFINNKFVPLNYEIDICMLATSIEESFITSQERYEKQIEGGDIPRYVTIEFVRDTDRKISKTLKKLENMSNIKSLKVFKRGNNETSLPILVYDSNTDNEKYTNVEQAVNACKVMENENTTAKKQLLRLKNIYFSKKNRKASEKEFEDLHRAINIMGLEQLDITRDDELS